MLENEGRGANDPFDWFFCNWMDSGRGSVTPFLDFNDFGRSFPIENLVLINGHTLELGRLFFPRGEFESYSTVVFEDKIRVKWTFGTPRNEAFEQAGLFFLNQLDEFIKRNVPVQQLTGDTEAAGTFGNLFVIRTNVGNFRLLDLP